METNSDNSFCDNLSTLFARDTTIEEMETGKADENRNNRPDIQQNNSVVFSILRFVVG